MSGIKKRSFHALPFPEIYTSEYIGKFMPPSPIIVIATYHNGCVALVATTFTAGGGGREELHLSLGPLRGSCVGSAAAAAVANSAALLGRHHRRARRRRVIVHDLKKSTAQM